MLRGARAAADRTIVNGPIAYTPDGSPLVGPAWGVPNVWLNEGHSFGVTAAGGMVDFRFKVLDADKAKVLTQDHSLMPILNVQGSDTRLAIPAGMHSMSFQDGKVYYILFGNPRGEVKPGTPISVAFGDLQVEPVLAQ